MVSQDLGARKGVVVSTGGGAVMRDQNWGHMSQGIVIWLKGAPELLTKRALSDGTQSRPLLSQSSDQVCLGLSSMCRRLRAPKIGKCGSAACSCATLDRMFKDLQGHLVVTMRPLQFIFCHILSVSEKDLADDRAQHSRRSWLHVKHQKCSSKQAC